MKTKWRRIDVSKLSDGQQVYACNKNRPDQGVFTVIFRANRGNFDGVSGGMFGSQYFTHTHPGGEMPLHLHFEGKK